MISLLFIRVQTFLNKFIVSDRGLSWIVIKNEFVCNLKAMKMGFTDIVYVLTLVISVVIISFHNSDADSMYDLYI